MEQVVSTLGELLDNAGTQWRVYDIGRRLTKIDKKTFADIEHNKVAYPFPLQQHAWLAIQFWNKNESKTPYVWFLKFPLDEQSKLVIASRDHFGSMVLEALGNQISGDDEKSDALNNNPYVFTPNANKRAVFNAQINVDLKQSASAYYEHCALYFSGKLGFDDWQSLALQGIADFSCRLNDENEHALINALPQLPDEVLAPLCAMLENIQISPKLTEVLLKIALEALQNNHNERLIHFLRALSYSKATGLVSEIVEKIIKSDQINDLNMQLTLAGRCWTVLTPHLIPFFEAVANSQSEEIFAGIFADLVAIDTLRPHVLAILRLEQRSEALARAIGRLFS